MTVDVLRFLPSFDFVSESKMEVFVALFPKCPDFGARTEVGSGRIAQATMELQKEA